MARIRSIKPELLEDEKTAKLSHLEWRLFVSLLLLADDYGNFRASPGRIQGAAFWGRSEGDVSAALETLSRERLIRLYSVDGQAYGHVRGWSKHQKVDHPGKPSCPAPPEETATPSRESRESLAESPSVSRLIGSDLKGLDLKGEEGRGVPARDPSGMAALALWSAPEWLSLFKRIWGEHYRRLTYGQGAEDSKATGDFGDMLAGIPVEERLEAQNRAAAMIREYLADTSPGRVKASHPWKWFVAAFNSLRVPAEMRAVNATGPPSRGQPSTATRDAAARFLARHGENPP